VDALTEPRSGTSTRISRIRFLFLSTSSRITEPLRSLSAPTGYAKNFAALDAARPGGAAGIGTQHWPALRDGEATRRGARSVLDACADLNLLENTIVLFTSDHGCHFKTRNGDTTSCHESSIRTPARCAARASTAARVGALVDRRSCADTCSMPRHRGAARDVGPPSSPAARAAERLRAEEVFVQISEAQTGRAVRTQRWKYSVRRPTTTNPWAEFDLEVYEDEFFTTSRPTHGNSPTDRHARRCRSRDGKRCGSCAEREW